MRRVKFKKFLGVGVDGAEKNGMSTEYIGVGWFHTWGTTWVEFDNGGVECTTAIIEEDGGEVKSIMPEHIKFVSPGKSNGG